MGEPRARALVIAIDGPAGSGKTTLARRLAEALDLPYVNTGLMYRALTLEALRAGVDLDDGPALADLMGRLRFGVDPVSRPPSLQVDGRAPSDGFTGPEVERNVSRVARHNEVRGLMRDEQRRLGVGGAVMEGRDIGSVVFPEADVKIFLVAAPGERVARRVRERGTGEEEGPAEGIADDLAARDALDARVNPFVPAEDAIALDTTGRDADEVLAAALSIVRGRLDAST